MTGKNNRGLEYNKGKEKKKKGLKNDTGQQNDKLNGNKINETGIYGTGKNHLRDLRKF